MHLENRAIFNLVWKLLMIEPGFALSDILMIFSRAITLNVNGTSPYSFICNYELYKMM